MAEDNNLSNIISNFKNMLNNNNIDSSNTTNNSEPTSNLNITPEMIGNLANMLKSSSENTSSAASSSPDFEDTSNNQSSSNQSSNNIDFETILKIKSIMETLNKKDDTRSKLLYSLKPYLRESRQKKIDQYVNLFKITYITNLFKNEKGAKN